MLSYRSPALSDQHPKGSSRQSSRTFIGLQYGRGIAAILVTGLHAQQIISLPQFGGRVPLGGLFLFGLSGVDFFFVLSGFIIFYIHRQDINRPGAVVKYATKRLIRIYPIYWVVMLLITVKYVLIAPNYDVEFWLMSIFLLPQSAPPLLPASWTLSHEMIFYFYFASIIMSKRIGLVIGALWLSYIMLNLPPDVRDLTSLSFSSPFNLLFFGGVMVAILAPYCGGWLSVYVGAAGLVAFVTAGILVDIGSFEGGGSWGIVSFGGAAMLLIAGLVGMEQGEVITYRGVGKHIGLWLGNLSYPLYLIHGAVLSPVIYVLSGVMRAPAELTFVCAVSVAVATGSALHYFVERPLMDFITRRKSIREVSSLAG